MSRRAKELRDFFFTYTMGEAADGLRDSSKAGDVDAVKKILATAMSSGGTAAVAELLKAGDRQVARNTTPIALRTAATRTAVSIRRGMLLYILHRCVDTKRYGFLHCHARMGTEKLVGSERPTQ